MMSGRSNIAVNDDIASRLTRAAERADKTAYAFANECLDAALKISESGGDNDEIYSAWVMNRIGKDVGALQFVGRNLLERLVKDFGLFDPEKFSQIWYQAGYNFGVYLQICFPKIEEVVSLVSQLRKSFNIGRVTFEEDQRQESGGGLTFTLTVVSSSSLELLSHLAEYWRGLLSAYGLEVADTKIAEGAVRIRFVSEGKLLKAKAEEIG